MIPYDIHHLIRQREPKDVTPVHWHHEHTSGQVAGEAKANVSRRFARRIFAGMLAALAASTTFHAIGQPTQPPNRTIDNGPSKSTPGKMPPRRAASPLATAESFVSRLMTLDQNGDQQLQVSEVADPRLAHLVKRANLDNDAVVSVEELKAYYARSMTTPPMPARP